MQKRTLNNCSSLFRLLTRFKISETFKLRGTPTKYNYRSLREILNVAISILMDGKNVIILDYPQPRPLISL